MSLDFWANKSNGKEVSISIESIWNSTSMFKVALSVILIENKIISIHNNQPIELFTQSSLALSLYVDHSTGAGIAVIFIY